MRKVVITLTTILGVALSGCATAEKSTLLGTGIGIGLGSTVGLLTESNVPPEHRGQGALIGAAVGGLLGGLIGYQAYKDKLKKEALHPTALDSAGLEILGNSARDGKRPTLRPAEVKVRYVDDQIKDGTFIPAHFEYDISTPAHWEEPK